MILSLYRILINSILLISPIIILYRLFKGKEDFKRFNEKLGFFSKKKYGEKIITHLIDKSKKIGIKKLSVETGAGEFFAPARKLFKNFGFKKCKPFAHYKEDPNSCYYSLNL